MLPKIAIFGKLTFVSTFWPWNLVWPIPYTYTSCLSSQKSKLNSCQKLQFLAAAPFCNFLLSRVFPHVYSMYSSTQFSILAHNKGSIHPNESNKQLCGLWSIQAIVNFKWCQNFISRSSKTCTIYSSGLGAFWSLSVHTAKNPDFWQVGQISQNFEVIRAHLLCIWPYICTHTLLAKIWGIVKNCDFWQQSVLVHFFTPKLLIHFDHMFN